MLRLYDYLRSGNGYKVRLLLHRLQIPFELVLVDIENGESRTPEFLRRNPNGRIPVLELEDGTCLAESNAIQWYLAEGTPMLPDARLARAQVLAVAVLRAVQPRAVHRGGAPLAAHGAHAGARAPAPGEARAGRSGARRDGAAARNARLLRGRAFLDRGHRALRLHARRARRRLRSGGVPRRAPLARRACARSRAMCRSRRASVYSGVPCRPAPAAKRAAPSRDSPERITSRPSRVSWRRAASSGRSHCS